MKYGYARVSTDDQSAALQLAALKRAGCSTVFKDEGLSGATTKHPSLLRCLPGRHHPHIHLPLPCQPDTGDETRNEVDHPPTESRHTGVRVEHHFFTARCWRVTSWSGRPRKTSEGKYRRNSPQRGHLTVIDWNGNSLTPDGMSRRHRLQVTTKTLCSTVGNPKAIE